jgi:hypothetical protein
VSLSVTGFGVSPRNIDRVSIDLCMLGLSNPAIIPIASKLRPCGRRFRRPVNVSDDEKYRPSKLPAPERHAILERWSLYDIANIATIDRA